MAHAGAARRQEGGLSWLERFAQGAQIVTALATFALVITGVYALVFAGRQIQETRDGARIQHLVQLAHDFDQPPIAEWRTGLAAKRIDKKNEKLRALDVNDAPWEVYEVLNFFEKVGLLAKRDYLNKRDILDMFGYWMFNLYADAAPVIKDEQKRDPEAFKDFVAVMHDLQKLEIELKGSRAAPKSDEIYEFYEAELRSSGRVLLRPPRHLR